MLLAFALLVGCGGRTVCPEGEVRDGDDCSPYVAGDPVAPGDAWQPAPGTSWQWQLSGAIDTSIDVEMYDIDMVDVPPETHDTLHADGRVVICYFSAGTIEDWRDDVGAISDDAIGKDLPEWDGEAWLDINDQSVLDVMGVRLDRAVELGCDGVEPDNVDGFDNRNGVGLNATEQLRYNRWLADEAHGRGLSIGLKNDMAQLSELLDWFDWALNEECADFNECGLYSTFTGAGKAVFNAEYVDDWADAQDKADETCGVGPGLDRLIKTWDLGPEWLACP